MSTALLETAVAAAMDITAAARPCPVCRARSVHHLYDQSYALFGDSELPVRTAIVACADCGTVFASSDATAASYRRHYARHSKYDTAVLASGSGESAADAARLEALVMLLARFAPKDACILDIGAGRGGLLSVFRSRGWVRGIGMDPSDGCVAAMRERDIEAHVGEIEDATWPTDPLRFDVIVLSHVLEHVFDADEVFRRVVMRAAPGGCVYIEVPDAAHYRLDGFPPFYFFDPEHINHFDETSLSAMAARSNWRVEATFHRNIPVEAGDLYPAVGVLLRRGSPIDPPVRVETANAIIRYAAVSRDSLQGSGATERIRALCERRVPLVLWGAGSHAQRLLAETELGNAAIDSIIDSDPGKQGRMLAGRRVVDTETGLARAAAIGAVIVTAIAVGGESIRALLNDLHPDLAMVVL